MPCLHLALNGYLLIVLMLKERSPKSYNLGWLRQNVISNIIWDLMVSVVFLSIRFLWSLLFSLFLNSFLFYIIINSCGMSGFCIKCIDAYLYDGQPTFPIKSVVKNSFRFW